MRAGIYLALVNYPKANHIPPALQKVQHLPQRAGRLTYNYHKTLSALLISSRLQNLRQNILTQAVCLNLDLRSTLQHNIDDTITASHHLSSVYTLFIPVVYLILALSDGVPLFETPYGGQGSHCGILDPSNVQPH